MRIICVSGSEANFRRVYESGLRAYCEVLKERDDEEHKLQPPLISCGWSLPRMNPEYFQEATDGYQYSPYLRFLQQETPFHFGREINNLIARAWQWVPMDDILLIEDDAPLAEDSEFDYEQMASIHFPPPDAGMVSAAVRGPVCNPLQKPLDQEPDVWHRDGGNMLAVMTVWMSGRALYEIEDRTQRKYGWWWDERFTGYGFDDDDVCRRMRAQGWKMYVNHGLIVDHQENSVWRKDEAAVAESMAANKRLYLEKWGTL
jgi:hypothetical protein